MGESTDVEAQIKLAAHATEIAHMKKAQEDMAEQLRAVNQTLQDINKTLSEARGGWKTLMWIGGASGAAGAILNHLFHNMPWKG